MGRKHHRGDHQDNECGHQQRSLAGDRSKFRATPLHVCQPPGEGGISGVDLVLDPGEDLLFVRGQATRIIGSGRVRGSHVEDSHATDQVCGAVVPVRR